MNKKGFAISGMIYTILLLFMMLIVMMLFNLQNRKMVLDEIKEEVVEAVEKDNEMELILKRIEVLENATNTFIKSHPVGSIYVTVASDEASVSMMNNKYTGSTWEAYGSGRTLVGVGSNGESEYLKSDLTGGKSNISLNTNQIPSLSISGTTASTGSGYSIGYTSASRTTSTGNIMQYRVVNAGGSNYAANHFTGWNSDNGYTASTDTKYPGQAHTHNYLDYFANKITGVEAHTHAFEGNYINNQQENVSIQNPYITVYMYKRIS